LKSGHHPLFIPTIPFFHYSIIPLWLINGTHHPYGVKLKLGPFSQDSLVSYDSFLGFGENMHGCEIHISYRNY